MATYTCTVFNSTPKSVHAGVNSVSGSINLAATASSVGDVIFLAKIPHGASFVSIEADHTTGATAQALSYGLATGGAAGGGASFSAFITSGAQATALRKNVLGLPAVVSVSDNDPNRYGILAAKVESGTATTSLIVNFVFNYRVDGVGG
jgi:hypothetical protein